MPGAPVPRPRRVRPRRPRARHLLRRPARGPAARRRGGPHRSGRVRPHRADSHGRGRACCSTGDQPVWMSHFDSIVRGAGGLHRHRTHARRARGRARARGRGASTACSSTPRSCTRPHGQELLRRFLLRRVRVRGRRGRWRRSSRRRSRPCETQVGDDRAICGLSGGVDSAVAAALVHRAIGHQLTCVYVDTGLMRKGESEQVVETFRRHMGIELIHVDAGDRFFERLRGVIDPEEKRKVIGELFIRDLRGAHRRAHRRRRSSCRARSTPTSSSRARPTPPSSRATTTSAACPRT